MCSTTMDVAESPLDDAELLHQITSPSLGESNRGNGNFVATAARALDVTTVISRASTHAEEVSCFCNVFAVDARAFCRR